MSIKKSLNKTLRGTQSSKFSTKAARELALKEISQNEKNYVLIEPMVLRYCQFANKAIPLSRLAL